MRVAQLMSQPPVTCSVNDSLNTAAQLMWEHDCGALPVVDGDGKVVGIVTDRDICMAAYTQGERLCAIPVTTAMAKQVFCCQSADTVDEAERLMSEKRVRRLPVVNGDYQILGMLSLNDLAQDASRPRNIGNGAQRGFVETMSSICRQRGSEVEAVVSSTPFAASAH